jgi:hypothetical protein
MFPLSCNSYREVWPRNEEGSHAQPSPGSLRPQSHRRSPCRGRAHGDLQLGLRPPQRRRVRPAHRRHRPRALDGPEYRSDTPLPRVVGTRLERGSGGRGTVWSLLSDPAIREVRGSSGLHEGERQSLSLLLLRRRARDQAGGHPRRRRGSWLRQDLQTAGSRHRRRASSRRRASCVAAGGTRGPGRHSRGGSGSRRNRLPGKCHG